MEQLVKQLEELKITSANKNKMVEPLQSLVNSFKFPLKYQIFEINQPNWTGSRETTMNKRLDSMKKFLKTTTDKKTRDKLLGFIRENFKEEIQELKIATPAKPQEEPTTSEASTPDIEKRTVEYDSEEERKKELDEKIKKAGEKIKKAKVKKEEEQKADEISGVEEIDNTIIETKKMLDPSMTKEEREKKAKSILAGDRKSVPAKILREAEAIAEENRNNPHLAKTLKNPNFSKNDTTQHINEAKVSKVRFFEDLKYSKIHPQRVSTKRMTPAEMMNKFRESFKMIY